MRLVAVQPAAGSGDHSNEDEPAPTAGGQEEPGLTAGGGEEGGGIAAVVEETAGRLNGVLPPTAPQPGSSPPDAQGRGDGATTQDDKTPTSPASLSLEETK